LTNNRKRIGLHSSDGMEGFVAKTSTVKATGTGAQDVGTFQSSTTYKGETMSRISTPLTARELAEQHASVLPARDELALVTVSLGSVAATTPVGNVSIGGPINISVL